MAHSPSPTSVHGGRRLSQSPTLAQQPLSKRDKRRTMIGQRLRDIKTNFNANQDIHLRTQLNTLSRDMRFITKAELYNNQLLDDGADVLSIDAPLSATGMGSTDGESRVSLGKHAAKFVEDVNFAMEKRDSELTNLDISFKRQLETLKLEYRFAIEVADAEHQALKDAARNRVTSTILAKKKLIQKEKDQLDTADSTFLMNSHALTTITTPGSPGGSSNRKTRHTRHNRQDPDTMEPIEPSRRKRKGVDLDNESPGPTVRTASIDTFGTLLWDKSKGSFEQDQQPPSRQSIDVFFNTRELVSHQRIANNAVAQLWSDKRIKRANGAGKFPLGDAHNDGDVSDTERRVSDDEAEPEDCAALVAPAMDRTGSHATRSTRMNNLDAVPSRDTIEDLDDPQRVYGSAVLDASQARTKAVPSKDIEAPMTVGMSPQGIVEDVGVLLGLIMEED